jgi:transposase-like protein
MNKEKLQEALDDGKSLNEISKEWGASLTNLRYWCKKLF